MRIIMKRVRCPPHRLVYFLHSALLFRSLLLNFFSDRAADPGSPPPFFGPLQLQIAKIVPVSVILRKEEDETDQSMGE